MRWFRRAAATEPTVAPDPSIRRAERLRAAGTPANAVITGIRFTRHDSSTRQEYAIALEDEGTWPRYGVRTQPSHGAHRLRLGTPVVALVLVDRAALDWEVMSSAWRLPDGVFVQESLRRPPADGVVDDALDERVRRWAPTSATIVAMRRGTSAATWDVDLRLADGRLSRCAGDGVPAYAQWHAAPGAVVPAVADPDEPGAAAIDWPAFALAHADDAGFDDDPPPGSIAAILERATG